MAENVNRMVLAIPQGLSPEVCMADTAGAGLISENPNVFIFLAENIVQNTIRFYKLLNFWILNNKKAVDSCEWKGDLSRSREDIFKLFHICNNEI